jgi:hypothetical protein
MKTVQKKLVGALVTTVLAGAVSAHAVIIAVDLGTSAPPMMLGGYSMTPFGLDPSPEYAFVTVTSVASPLGSGDYVRFSIPLSHRVVGSSWGTWSHGYNGDVYYTTGALSVTLTLPAGTGAFYLYAEPNPFSVHTITVTANDGTSLSVPVNGYYGANGYGFYLSGLGSLTTLTITSTVDFAIGEFGIAKWSEIPRVPEGWSGLSSLWAFGLALASMGGLRLRRCRS